MCVCDSIYQLSTEICLLWVDFRMCFGIPYVILWVNYNSVSLILLATVFAIVKNKDPNFVMCTILNKLNCLNSLEVCFIVSKMR